MKEAQRESWVVYDQAVANDRSKGNPWLSVLPGEDRDPEDRPPLDNQGHGEGIKSDKGNQRRGEADRHLLRKAGHGQQWHLTDTDEDGRWMVTVVTYWGHSWQ